MTFLRDLALRSRVYTERNVPGSTSKCIEAGFVFDNFLSADHAEGNIMSGHLFEIDRTFYNFANPNPTH